MSKETLGLVRSGIGMGLALVGVKYDIYLLVIVGFIAFSVGSASSLGAGNSMGNFVGTYDFGSGIGTYNFGSQSWVAPSSKN